MALKGGGAGRDLSAGGGAAWDVLVPTLRSEIVASSTISSSETPAQFEGLLKS